MIPHRRFLFGIGVFAFLLATPVGAAPPEGNGPSGPKGDVLPIKPRVLKAHDRIVAAIAFSPDSKTLVSAGIDGKVCLWQVATGERLLSWRAHEDGAYAVAFTPDGKFLATGGADHLVRLWDPKSGKEIRSFKGHEDKVSAVAISPDGKILASGSYDKTIRLWDLASGKELRRLKGHGGPITALSFSPDGNTFVSGGTTATDFRFGGSVIKHGHADFIRLWEVDTGKLIRTFESQGIAVQFSPDGRCVAGGGLFPDDRIIDGRLRINGLTKFCILDAITGQNLLTVPFRGGGVAFSATGRLLATDYGGSSLHIRGNIVGANGANAERSDYTITFWEVASGQEVLRLPEDAPQLILFSPDDQTLATAQGDGTVRIWNISLASLGAQKKSPESGILARCWADLGAKDARAAYRAVFQLATLDGQAVSFLKDKLLSQPVPDGKVIDQLIANLDANDFAVRESSSKKLKAFGRAAEPAIREAYSRASSAEVKRRLASLIHSLGDAKANPEYLRSIRAIQALEMLGSIQAREALEVLAKRGGFTTLGLEARHTVQRLAQRQQ